HPAACTTEPGRPRPKMPALPTERKVDSAAANLARLQMRFPGFQVRPARPSDFRAMARIATNTFRDEHETSHFTRYRRSFDPTGRAEKLTKVEFEWRLATMHQNRRLLGRHFVVATHLRQPVEYMTKLEGAHEAREVLLGWAEFQEPMCALDAVGRPESQFPPGEDPFANASGKGREPTPLVGSGFAGIESILQSMEAKCEGYTVLIPPNSGAVYLRVAMEGFQRARLDDTEEWRRWCREFLPGCLGPTGDTQGRYLALRAIAVDSTHWGEGIERELLDWGIQKARSSNWDIVTLAPSVINPWTLDCFFDLGFKEVGCLDIFWGSQHALKWDCSTGRENSQRQRKADKVALPKSSKAATSAIEGEEPEGESAKKLPQVGTFRRSRLRRP
ncbi:hypothetical protein C8A03DRAFT_17016, partial [Achaetomium macrosporum]